MRARELRRAADDTVATLSAEQGQATSTEHGMPIFGQLALLDRNPRTTTAVCKVDTKLLVLPLESWAAASLALPDIKARLRRLRELPNGAEVG